MPLEDQCKLSTSLKNHTFEQKQNKSQNKNIRQNTLDGNDEWSFFVQKGHFFRCRNIHCYKPTKSFEPMGYENMTFIGWFEKKIFKEFVILFTVKYNHDRKNKIVF